MAMTTASAVGRLLGRTFTDVSPASNPTETQVTASIAEAAQEVLRHTCRRVNGWYDRDGAGRIHGYTPSWYGGSDTDAGYCNDSNKVFFLRENALPVADTNDDGSIDSSDVTIVVYDSSADDLDRSTYSVSTIDQRTGKITLNTAPSENDRIYAEYSYYISNEVPNTSLMSLACATQTALWLWQNPTADITQIIDSYSLPGISISKGAQGMLTAKNIDLSYKYLHRLYNEINRGKNVSYW